MEPDHVVILCTASPEVSMNLAKILVEEKLAACVNVAPIRSCFRWDGEICDQAEDLMIIKTKKETMDDIMDRLKEAHPYELPEIIALPIIGGEPQYLEWISLSVR